MSPAIALRIMVTSSIVTLEIKREFKLSLPFFGSGTRSPNQELNSFLNRKAM